MFPQRETEINATIPASAEYWIPGSSDIDEEGYGLSFRDVYPILDVAVADARAIVEWEHAATNWVSAEATDEAEFEALAETVESYDPDFPEESQDSNVLFPDNLLDSVDSLCGLELGVSGLSHSLAATGFYPVASCRSHFEHSWSLEPVVLFATTETMLREIQPLIAKCGCGLDADTTRGRPLFVVYSSSIFEIMDLAEKVLSHHDRFLALSVAAIETGSTAEETIPESIEQPKLF